ILRRIPDYQGRPMYTEERLFSYLQQFERDFARSKARIIDATEGGAAKRGAQVMTLAEVIRDLGQRDPVAPDYGAAPAAAGGGEDEVLAAVPGCLARRTEEA